MSAADVPFFLVSTDPNSHATVKHLKDWETCQSDGHKVCPHDSLNIYNSFQLIKYNMLIVGKK